MALQDWCWHLLLQGGPQMAHGARLSSVVMFVHDLDRSVKFYTGILGLAVADRSPTAALLSNAEGTQLVLRAMGLGADRALGSVGVQYVVWTAAGKEELERCEQVLREHGAHRETRVHGVVSVVEPGPRRHCADDHLPRPGRGSAA